MTSLDITDDDLRLFYPDPRVSGKRSWVRANFVTAPNGVVQINGKSEALSGPPDKLVFGFLRKHCDAILVGAATARMETYTRPKSNPTDGTRPLLVIVTNSLDVSKDASFLDKQNPPLIVTTSAAIKNNQQKLNEIGTQATVEAHGEQSVDFAELFGTLLLRGYRTVLCEGGPTIFSTLLLEGLIDELCLTITPLLGKGNPTGIAHIGDTESIKMTLGSHFEINNYIFSRYLIEHS